jgi:hypothetical protein
MSVIEEFTAAPAPARYRHTLLPCEIYQAWQAASEDAEEAYLAWCAAAYGQKSEAYAVYRAAVDREDVATERWLAV